MTWHRTADRKPTEGDAVTNRVLVTTKTGVVCSELVEFAHLHVAWQPLPAPYVEPEPDYRDAEIKLDHGKLAQFTGRLNPREDDWHDDVLIGYDSEEDAPWMARATGTWTYCRVPVKREAGANVDAIDTSAKPVDETQENVHVKPVFNVCSDCHGGDICVGGLGQCMEKPQPETQPSAGATCKEGLQVQPPLNSYEHWANGGGPNECKHGIAAGIPCHDCSAVGVDNTKPTPAPVDWAIDWAKAPEWAMWAAMDKNKEWWFYRGEPTLYIREDKWWGADGCQRFYAAPFPGDWRQSKQQRPTDKQARG